MHLITDQYSTKDRWVLDITKINPKQSQAFEPRGTDYVLLLSADMQSDRISLKGAIAATTMTAPYEITCGADAHAAVISTYGLCLPENTVTMVDTGLKGNLTYMDGGTNTNAINPSREGDPVVNYVWFPPGMDQTPHIHPSHRIGLCLDGTGRTDLQDHTVALQRGDLFFMARTELHHFVTERDPCVLFVFAPDSETGPTDESNPLKARTYIGK